MENGLYKLVTTQMTVVREFCCCCWLFPAEEEEEKSRALIGKVSPTPPRGNELGVPPRQASPVPVENLATCEIIPGRETTIEITKEKSGLGLSIVGGTDTLLARLPLI